MPPTLWFQEARRRLAGLAQTIEDWAPSTLYGALAGASLLPLAMTSGDPKEMLAGIIGGIGTNLVANQVEAWRARNDGDETALAKQLSEAAKADATLRDSLDELLRRMGALEVVIHNTAEAEREATVQTLARQFAKLNSGIDVGEIYVGGDWITTGNISNAQNIIVGSGNTQSYTHIETQMIHQAPTPPPPHTERYLQRLRNHCHALPLTAMGGDATAGDEVTLDKVYIDLDTTTQVALTAEEQARRKADRVTQREKERPLAAREAAQTAARLVLLGAPGSGKSTFVRQLIAQLIQARLEDSAPPAGFTSDLFPLLTILRELAQRLQALSLTGLSNEAQEEVLVQCLHTQWQSDLARFGGADLGEQLEEALLAGKVVLVFDGLDEMATATRPMVRLALAALLRRYPTMSHVIVTCRIRSYVETATLPGFTAYTLADFDKAKIEAFVAAWYGAQVKLGRLDSGKAQSQRADLQGAALRPALRAMAANPMLLTTMAIIHQKQTRLPDERVKLYDEAVKVLLNRWQESKGLAPSPALADFLRDERRVRPTLERLAYEAHRQKGKAAADLPRATLLTLLEEAFAGDLTLVGEFLDYADHRAGLLVGQGGGEGGGRPQSYAFPHRTFQEYLAGCHLLAGEGNQRGVSRVYRSHAAEGDYWQLAAQLGAEELFFNRRGEALLLDLMYALCPVTPPQSEQAWRTTLWSGQMALLLERKAIAQDEDNEEGGQAYLDRLIPRLLAIMRESPLNAIERAEAGRILASLGDPRFRADAWSLPDDPMLGFVEMPAGKFIMGSDQRKDKDARDDETPQHEVELPAFYIARYPVTVAQFRAFVEATGEPPRDADSLADPDNYPVRWVTWHEATRYCAWLTETLRTWDKTPEPLADKLAQGWQIMLPSEAEWERAARGLSPSTPSTSSGVEGVTELVEGVTELVEGRRYPWGNEPVDPNRANYDTTAIGTTSAVGCFPAGATPEGIEELAGNVWEWTRSRYMEYPYPSDEAGRREREQLKAKDSDRFVQRGGSAYSIVSYMRAPFRGLDHAVDFIYGDDGLRVVCGAAPRL